MYNYNSITNIFFSDFIIKLCKQIGSNDILITLIENCQLRYKFIYCLIVIKYEKLKIKIKTNLAINLIKFFKL